MTADLKTCVDCGEKFKRSRADRTIRCLDCRDRRQGRTPTAEIGPGWALADGVTETKTKLCGCGKTVLVDGFGARTGWECPRLECPRPA